MKVHVIGGGPAGLYFAILMKKAWPETRITVFERNRPDDTFGFGVVFSDQTLETFEANDPESYRAIIGHFAYWDDIAIHFRGSDAPHRRQRILRLLARDHAAENSRPARASLGIDIKYGSEADPIEAHDPRCRSGGGRRRHQFAHAREFQGPLPAEHRAAAQQIRLDGLDRPIDAFKFFFRETPHGIFIAHCYQYQPGRSTWVMETDPETFERAGLGKLDEAASARFLESVFAEELAGHKLITNRSIWRNFPTIRCERWTTDNVVLIGDAKATAHFSIGSGTKLAMEDAIALYEAFR